MDFTITTTIHIDIEAIANHYIEAINFFQNIREAVVDYVCGLDDCEYYIIDEDTITAITKAVEAELEEREKK